MTGEAIGLYGILVLFVLLALRMPVGLALIITGTLGIWAITNLSVALSTLGDETWVVVTQSTLVVIPLFILMGNIASVSGMSRNLYDAAFAFVGHRRGGLAGATIIGCGGFAALSGSSVASALTMGRVALPEMERFKYDDRLATGAVAAGGTLGILIPPSTGFIVYAILTEESIGQLFIAGHSSGTVVDDLIRADGQYRMLEEPRAGPIWPTKFNDRARGRTDSRSTSCGNHSDHHWRHLFRRIYTCRGCWSRRGSGRLLRVVARRPFSLQPRSRSCSEQ